MRLLHVTFERDITLSGTLVVPRTFSAEVDEHRRLFQISYDPNFMVIEVKIVDPRSKFHGQTFVVPRERAVSWVSGPDPAYKLGDETFVLPLGADAPVVDDPKPIIQGVAVIDDGKTKKKKK